MPEPMIQFPSAVLIAGPTASGKSALAMALADRINGTIINADSMQIYRDLRILSARPTVDDEERIPHALYGHVDAAASYSAGHYAKDVSRALEKVRGANRVPVIVGGTGLYFKVLLDGLSPVPAINAEIRAKWRDAGQTWDAGKLHRTLAEMDPQMAAILRPSDRQRMVRALEVKEQTGCSLAHWQGKPGTPVLHDDGTLLKLVVLPPRGVLHARANVRFEQMMARGAVNEVRALMARDLGPSSLVTRALGVRPISEWLAGKRTVESAVERGQAETRQYIKRQTTWLKSNMMSWNKTSAQQMKSQMDEMLTFIDF